MRCDSSASSRWWAVAISVEPVSAAISASAAYRTCRAAASGESPSRRRLAARVLAAGDEGEPEPPRLPGDEGEIAIRLPPAPPVVDVRRR